jgi:ATP citrate (pro-S)-lyase
MRSEVSSIYLFSLLLFPHLTATSPSSFLLKRKQLGNYAEYSGAPNEAETYEYAKKVLSVATAGAGDGKKRALVVGGGIANFTDVAATFKGIIRALEGAAESLQKAQMKVLVRRGGPNYKAGLEAMRQLGKRSGLDVEVYGPEATMTGICARAIEWVKA